MTAGSPSRVVFLLHGIRASNNDQWVQDLDKKIKLKYLGTRVVSPTYGFLTAAGFVVPRRRREKIRFFKDIYTETLAREPKAEFYAVAHSNGTYVLGRNLLRIRGMQFRRIALAGSVLPDNYPWDSMTSFQVGTVVNYRANKDWPVAILCSALRQGLFMRDVGTAGFTGFLGASVSEVAYFQGKEGGHGGALSSSHLDDIVDFLFTGTVKNLCR